MHNGKFTYKESWYRLTKDLSAKARLEVMDAIVSYAFSGEEPPMGMLARGIFTSIKMELDAEKIKKEKISQKRAEAGKKHKGNQHTKLEQMEQMFQSACKSNEKEQVKEMEQNGTNGTSVPKMLKIKEFGTNVPDAYNINNNNLIYNINNNYEDKNIIIKEEKEKKEENNNYAYACARMLEWLGDNEEQMIIMCKRNGIIENAEPKEKMLELLRPYAEEFVEMERVREDISRGMRREVKQHFENWFRCIMKKRKENDGKNKRSDGDADELSQENTNYWDV